MLAIIGTSVLIKVCNLNLVLMRAYFRAFQSMIILYTISQQLGNCPQYKKAFNMFAMSPAFYTNDLLKQHFLIGQGNKQSNFSSRLTVTKYQQLSTFVLLLALYQLFEQASILVKNLVTLILPITIYQPFTLGCKNNGICPWSNIIGGGCSNIFEPNCMLAIKSDKQKQSVCTLHNACCSRVSEIVQPKNWILQLNLKFMCLPQVKYRNR